MRRSGVVLVGVLLVGCAAGPSKWSSAWRDPATGVVIFDAVGARGYTERIEITSDGAPLWITETRVKVRALVGIPYGSMPVDVGFPTREGCEQYRASHPTYTRPDEVCQVRYYRPYKVEDWGAGR